MLSGAFALLERSLRVDARGWSTHLARVGLIGAIYFWLCLTMVTFSVIGAPGLHFFQGIAFLDAIFMTLMGISFFSTVITEEKEEDTLGLMMMAGISPLGILAGKSVGRLVQALLLIAVQFPFMVLSVTLGGVMPGQIWAMALALLAYMVFLGGFGLLCSTVSPRSRTSGTLMTIGIVFSVVTPYLAKALIALHSQSLLNQPVPFDATEFWWWVVDLIGDASVFVRMSEILSSGFNQSPFSFQVFSNIAVGMICAALSWLLFDMVTRNLSTEAASRGGIAQRRGFLRFTAGRVWSNPFMWKDFHFVSGGNNRLIVRFVYYLGLGVGAFSIQQTFHSGTDSWIPLHLSWILLSLPIDAALLVARSMRDEIRDQTLSALLMLPCTTKKVVYSKYAGALIGWIPGPIIGIMLMLCTEYGRSTLSEMSRVEVMWIIPLGVLYISLIPHFAAVFALYIRWGAVPLAIAATFAVYIANTMIAGILFAFWAAAGGTELISLMIIQFYLITLALLISCHIAILLRVQALGAR